MIRTLSSTEIAPLHFAKIEVLTNEQDRISRLIDLKSAMAVTNIEHEEIGLIVQLANGEQVEILSSIIDVEGDVVEVKGGHVIPISAILRVEI